MMTVSRDRKHERSHQQANPIHDVSELKGAIYESKAFHTRNRNNGPISGRRNLYAQAPPTDAQIAGIVQAANQIDIIQARLALSKSNNADVKEHKVCRWVASWV